MSRASSKLARVGLVIEAEILALGEGLCIASRFVLQQPHGIGFSDSMDYSHKVFGLRPGWVPDQLNDPFSGKVTKS
ncbi:hypothetical protein CK203_038543 [Vitis vinifera]|uniref:Uncharacterized protein n=1 Tax=Vitis vinifera TaxID=29760 RepID=A0A438I442_VITVI|nr:hypothetical protein CK203_091013 [Vitis vinifera]RVW91476.1 hypothetical protein CK203_038543 [Vitis vinifera]